MPSFSTTRRVRHSPQNMFALVADIERYPEFMPLCQALRITERRREGGHEVLIARMTVAYKFIRESFTSRVVLKPEEGSIVANYLDGPFRKLENRWSFASAEAGGCDVRFAIDYEFRSRAFQLLAGAVFDQAFRKFSAAFEARADAIYGRDGVTPPAHLQVHPGEA
ncbi:MAG: type II toxin-antitoxin system RatA family toxin [Chitinophagales bacterium]|nr:type II toxin-antitoxin system RatA family toxin [Hyphomicrobiales bacterium]